MFSICISIYFSIIGIRKYVIIILYVTSVALVHRLFISNEYKS